MGGEEKKRDWERGAAATGGQFLCPFFTLHWSHILTSSIFAIFLISLILSTAPPVLLILGRLHFRTTCVLLLSGSLFLSFTLCHVEVRCMRWTYPPGGFGGL